MKKTILFFTVVLLEFTTLNAQEQKTNAKEKVNQLNQQKDEVKAKEKERLKIKIQKIEELKNNGKISSQEAETRKKEAAIKHARNIENQLDLIDLNIALIKRNREDSTAVGNYINIGSLLTKTAPKKPIDSIPNSTQIGSIIGLGISSIITGKHTDQTKGIPISGELGVLLTSIIEREHPNWHLIYGFSMDFTQFRIQNNQYLEMDNTKNILKNFPYQLDKQNFSFANLIFPLHLEFNRTEINFDDDRAYYDVHSKWSYGLGGYLGFKLSSTQKLDYNIDGRYKNEEITRNYNTNNFLYGLSSYIAYEKLRFSLKYQLNDLFKHSDINGNMLSVRLSLFF